MRSKTLASGATAALIAALVVANPAAAQSETESYIVLMDAPPAITLDTGLDDVLSDDEAVSARALARLDRQAPEPADPASSAVQRYQDDLEDEQDEVLEAVADTSEPVQRFTFALNGFSAELTEQEAGLMAAQKGVMTVVPNELYQLQTDVSGDFLELTARRGAWDAGLTGEGATVGVIDSGIWPEHASFADDGSYSRPEGLANDIPCEFGDTAHNPDDAPFDCNNKLVGARDMRLDYKAFVGPETYATARDYDGHGTHTASTAAGNADVDAEIFGIDRGTVSGVAPRASIVAYSACGDLGCFGSDLAAAIDQAVADGVDVINYSIGSSSPGLTGPDDIAFLFAENAGVHVATSNGNAGPGAQTVGSPASVPWVTSVGASTHDRTFENPVQIGNLASGGFLMIGTSITEASTTAPLVDSEDLGNQLCLPGVGFDEDVTGKIVLCARGQNARVEKSKVVADAGGAGMILHNENDAQALITDSHYIPSTHVNLSTGLEIKAYIDAAGAGATARIGQGEATPRTGSVMADFSSRGPVGTPASADIIKPDVTAPGVNILAGNTPTPTLGRPGQLFQSISGTSMSSPHVAGLFALLTQAHPDWSPAAAKSALMTTARQDVLKEDATTAADPLDMGAGHVDPGKPHRKNSMFQPGVVYETGFQDYLAFLCGVTDVVAPSTCDALVGVGLSTDAVDLNSASIGVSSIAASATVTRSITNVTNQRANFIARVDEPEGFDVTVSPRRLVLRPGQTGTVEITFDNVSSTPDQWAFGSLTWRGGGHQARSPIAVKGALFEAPAQVDGEGASGTASFDVAFGYDGDYTAAPHGLAPEVLSHGTVVQDPDQAFDPDDGFSTPIEFDLSDTALFRFTMDQSDVEGPGAGSADLDLFLLNEAGDVVAASTAGGTQEVVDLLLPEPGTYTMWVHGWQTGGEELSFTGHSWTIPLTPGTGNLEVTDAPTQAESGESGTVDIAWSGVAPSSTALGAVSHANADGLLGLTLVSVVNDDEGDGGDAAGPDRATAPGPLTSEFKDLRKNGPDPS